MERVSNAARLALFALAGQLLNLGLSVLLARHLDVQQFEAYVVAGSIFLVLLAISPLGLDKYAVRLVPGMVTRGEWRSLTEFIRFSSVCILVFALIAATGVAAFAKVVEIRGEARAAIVVACISLPAAALVHFGIEVMTGLGREVRATIILRVLVPFVALCCVGLLVAWGGITAAAAIACWLTGWMVALTALAWRARAALLAHGRSGASCHYGAEWTAAARPFLI